MTSNSLTKIVRNSLAKVNAIELRVKVRALPLYPKKEERWSVTILGWLPTTILDQVQWDILQQAHEKIEIKLSDNVEKE